MASSNMKDVKRRIKSVESTMQITKAMELVASSKLRRAKERADNVKPFFDSLMQIMFEITSQDKAFSSVFKNQSDGNSVLMIVVAGDRGLAGGFNSNVLKLAQKRIDEVKAESGSVAVMAIGKKSVEYFRKRDDVRLVATYEGIAEHIKINQSMKISSQIIDAYTGGKVNRVELVYTSYVSPLVQEAGLKSILPVENIYGNFEPSNTVTTYEPSPEAVFDRLIPKYIAGIIYSSVADSFAAEQAARRLAMENATDNASEMIDNLSLIYNRARQTSITQEITEIVGGASAQN